jgi:hypothetical protein
MGLVSAAIVAPVLALMYATYGSIFSQSVIAKTVLPTPSPLHVLEKFLIPEPLMALAVVAALFGAIHAWRDGGLTRLILIWVGLYFLAYLIARPFVWSWYGEPVFYLAVLLAGRALPPLLERLPDRWKLPRTVPVAVAAGVLAVIGWTAVWAYRSPSAVESMVQQPLAAWCADSVTPATTFCAYDIGALGFYSRAYITDLAGLVTRGVVERSTAEVVLEKRPDFVFVVADRTNIRAMSHPELRELYVPIKRLSAAGATEMALDTNLYPAGWSHDYMIYRRR